MNDSSAALGIGKRIVAIRLARGMSQRDLGNALKLPRTNISKWENDGSVPGLESIERIARALKVCTGELLHHLELDPIEGAIAFLLPALSNEQREAVLNFAREKAA